LATNQHSTIPKNWNTTVLEESSLRISKALAKNPKQYAHVEQGKLALDLLCHHQYNWTLLEAMFARRRMYIETRIEDALHNDQDGNTMAEMWQRFAAKSKKQKQKNKRKRCLGGLDHIDEWNACYNDEQKYRLLRQLQSKYENYSFPKKSRANWAFHLGAMCGTDSRVVKRIFSTTTFVSSVVYRLENYHGVKDLDTIRGVVEKVQGKISITCYCGKTFMNHQPWHIHHCHDCGQLIGMCHSGCNTDEPHSTKVMDWMWGPGNISRIHVVAADRYDAPFLKPEECQKCLVRKVMD